MVAINKPHGLLVHPSSLARDASQFALHLLRDQLGQKVYPVHRLDRKTGGVLMFSLDKALLPEWQQSFRNGWVKKKYLAIVRGYIEQSGSIDYPIKKENGKLQEAVTNYKCLHRAELHFPFGIHQTSRYSLVEIQPLTGRMHQIRKHFSHIRHPIIGDRPHGCNKQNRLFKEKWNMETMMLHALEASLLHPVHNHRITIRAKLQAEFLRMMHIMSWELDLLNIKDI